MLPAPVFVFAKPPRAGVSKTRLSATIGDSAAVALAVAFLEDTLELIRAVGLRPVLATTEVDADFGLEATVDRVDQGEGTLGDRLDRVFRSGLAQAPVVMALGGDSPGLAPAQLLALATDPSDCTVIPATDGGFVGIALRRLPAGLFDDIPWSTPETLDHLLERAHQSGLHVQLLEGWFDIDVEADLEQFRRRVPRDRAPHTWAALP